MYQSIKDVFSHHAPFISLLSLMLLLSTAFLAVNLLRDTQDIRSSAAGSECSVAANDIQLDNEEKKAMDEVNKFRRKNNRDQLKHNELLQKAAEWMARDMEKRKDSTGHTDSHRREALDRARDCGYPGFAYERIVVAENVYGGTGNGEDAFTWWDNSPPHHATMLIKEFEDVGVARFKDGNKWYWSMKFGKAVKNNTATPTTIQATNTPKPTREPRPTRPGRKTPTPDPTRMLSGTRTPAPTRTNTSGTELSFTIEIPGIGQGGNDNPSTHDRDIEVILTDEEDNDYGPYTGTVSFDGADYFVGTVPLDDEVTDGSYLIRIKVANTLRKIVVPEIQEITAGENHDLPTQAVIPGDFDEDDAVTIKDNLLLVDCLDSGGCSKQDSFDMNDDSELDIADYNLFLDSFSTYHGA
jgi:uncharacterized protein YkwD